MYCLCLKIKGNGKRMEKGFEESGASSASCGQMFPPNPGFGCPGTVVCWADGNLPVFSQWGLSARCGTGWGSSDEPFRLGGDPGATIRVEASSSHSTERMGLGDGAGPLSHNSHLQPFAPPSHRERGVRERDSGAGFFFWHVRYLFAFFYFKGEKGDVHTGCGLVSGKSKGKALYFFFFSQHIRQNLLSDFVYGAEVNGTMHMEKGRADTHNLATLSSPPGRREASRCVAGLRFLSQCL